MAKGQCRGILLGSRVSEKSRRFSFSSPVYRKNFCVSLIFLAFVGDRQVI